MACSRPDICFAIHIVSRVCLVSFLLSYLVSLTKSLTHRLNERKIDEAKERQIHTLRLKDRMATTNDRLLKGITDAHKLTKICCTIWSSNVRLKVK